MLLSTDLGYGGGAEEQVIALGLALWRRGWQVQIVSMLPPSPLPRELEESGIVIRHLGMRKGSPDPRALRLALQYLREFRPHVLHTHMTHANLLGRLTRLFHRVPVLISTLHGMKMFGIQKRFTLFRELGHRLTDPLCDLTTTICQAAAESYREAGAVPASKLRVVHNGVDTRRYAPDPAARAAIRQELGLSPTGFVWLAAGRLEAPKDYPLMLRAFAALEPGSTLLICGSGSLEEQLKQIAPPAVRFLGIRRDIPAMMAAADAFVLSSETEGLPMVLLQASAAALPIVATNVGGNAEVIHDGVTGWITRPGDAGALAAAMRRVVELPPAARRAIGAAGREATRARFDEQQIFDQWIELYASFLTPRAGAGHQDQPCQAQAAAS